MARLRPRAHRRPGQLYVDGRGDDVVPPSRTARSKALAVTSPGVLPCCPLRRQIYPGYEAMVVHAGARQHARACASSSPTAWCETLHAPAMKTNLGQQGAQVSGRGGPAFATMIKSEIQQMVRGGQLKWHPTGLIFPCSTFLWNTRYVSHRDRRRRRSPTR